MNNLANVLRENFDSLKWDNEQKTTAKEFFGHQWQTSIATSIGPGD